MSKAICFCAIVEIVLIKTHTRARTHARTHALTNKNENNIYATKYNGNRKRLFLLRKLKSFDVSQHILQLVYRSLIESVLSFNIITWYGNVSGKNKVKLARVVNTASKLIGNNQKQLSSIYKDALKRKSTQILNKSCSSS